MTNTQKTGLGLGLLAGAAAGLALFSSTGDADALDTVNPSFSCASVTVLSARATAMPTTCTPSRSAVVIQNNDSASIFIGGSTVTNSGATKGLTIAAGAYANIEVSCDPSSRTARVYAYSAAGTAANAITVCETK